jgi:hypothetical protein
MYLDKRLKDLLTAYELRIVALEELAKVLEAKVVQLQEPTTKRVTKATKTVDKS